MNVQCEPRFLQKQVIFPKLQLLCIQCDLAGMKWQMRNV